MVAEQVLTGPAITGPMADIEPRSVLGTQKVPEQWLVALPATSLRDRQTEKHMIQGYLLLAGKKKKTQTTYIVNSLVIVVKWEAVRDSEVCG